MEEPFCTKSFNLFILELLSAKSITHIWYCPRKSPQALSCSSALAHQQCSPCFTSGAWPLFPSKPLSCLPSLDFPSVTLEVFPPLSAQNQAFCSISLKDNEKSSSKIKYLLLFKKISNVEASSFPGLENGGFASASPIYPQLK